MVHDHPLKMGRLVNCYSAPAALARKIDVAKMSRLISNGHSTVYHFNLFQSRLSNGRQTEITLDRTRIITQARLRQAAGELDAINRVRFLYICRALGHLS